MSFNIYESTENYLLQTKIPGVDPTSLNISVENNTLNIKGSRNIPKGKPLLREHSQSEFSKSIQLNQNIDTDAIKAEYQKGLLSLTLPKRAKRIDIKVA